jgi:pimeloyl-ACP methyl ester carboxylesterase
MTALVLYGFPRHPDAPASPSPAVPEPPRVATTATAAREDFITPGAISERAIEAFVAAALASDPVRADWRATEGWVAIDPGAVRVPTLVIQGVHDPYAPRAAIDALVERLDTDHKRRIDLAGTDHAAHLEDPHGFVEAVVDFFDDVRRADAPR